MIQLRFTTKKNSFLFFDIYVPDRASRDCLIEHFKNDKDFVISTSKNGLVLANAVSDAIAHVEQERKELQEIEAERK